MKWIVTTGSLVEGFDFFGPFENEKEAAEFGEQELEPEYITWSPAPMFEPEPGWNKST